MANFTKRPTNDKEYKNLLVYNILRYKKEVSRADLTSITRINPVSISNYINTFIKKGMVIEKELGASSGGRPPIILKLNPKYGSAAGFHITKKKVNGILLNLELEKEKEISVGHDQKNVSEKVIGIINDFAKSSQENALKGAAFSADYYDENITSLKNDIEKSTGLSAYETRPSICSAYAEFLLRDNYSGMKFVYSHRDIGECVYSENFGYYTHDDDLDNLAYLKPWGENLNIVNSVTSLIEQGAKSELLDLAGGKIEDVTEKEIIEAASKKDTVSCDALEFAGLNLGVRIAYIINVFRPEKMILGGGVESAGGRFIDPVKRIVSKLANEDMLEKVEIAYTMSEGDAAARGASSLIFREIFMGV